MRERSPVLLRGAAAILVLGVAVFALIGPSDEGTEAPPAQGGDRGPGITLTRVVSKDGHEDHPTWYHNTQIVEQDGAITVAYNGNSKTFAAQMRAEDLEIVRKTRLDETDLGGTTDSTGTDTNRHDVPAVGADAAGRLHFLYGGGSLAAEGEDGPLLRQTSLPNDIRSLGPERSLFIGGGAAYDFEAAKTRDGVTHFVGQYGRGNTGSLVELRLLPDGGVAPAREIIRGGFVESACVEGGRPRGCNRFAIARLAAGPDGRSLHLTWGYSEDNLSNSCSTDRGYCDVNLYYAVSRDGGRRWSDAQGRITADVDRGPIGHADRRFLVTDGQIGLFKALTVHPDGTPLIVHSAGPEGRRSLYAQRLVDGRWRRSVVARTGQGAKSYEGAPVLRADPEGYSMWIPTGERILRFSSPDGQAWERAEVYRGPAWSLTGVPSTSGPDQLLVWRGEQDDGSSHVMLGRAPVGP